MKSRWHLMILMVLASVILNACAGAAVPVTGQAPVATASTTTQVAAVLTVQPPAPAQVQEATSQTTAPTQAAPIQNTQVVQPAASCVIPAALTPTETEGPFFKANSPQRTSLLDAGMAGTKLILSGYVFTPDCKPVANALLDFWQADSQGQYDNSGYTLRGHLFADASGHYQLTTIIPGLYPGRTEHIHVKVQAPNGPILTTQLFVPGVPNNDSDSIYDPRLLMTMQDANGVKLASYNFIVNVK